MVKSRRFRRSKKSKRPLHHKRHKRHSTHRRKLKRHSKRGTKRRRRTRRVKRGGARKNVMKGGGENSIFLLMLTGTFRRMGVEYWPQGAPRVRGNGEAHMQCLPGEFPHILAVGFTDRGLGRGGLASLKFYDADIGNTSPTMYDQGALQPEGLSMCYPDSTLKEVLDDGFYPILKEAGAVDDIKKLLFQSSKVAGKWWKVDWDGKELPPLINTYRVNERDGKGDYNKHIIIKFDKALTTLKITKEGILDAVKRLKLKAAAAAAATSSRAAAPSSPSDLPVPARGLEDALVGEKAADGVTA